MTEIVGERVAGATNAVDSDRVELPWHRDLWFLGALILVAVSLVVSIVRALTDHYLPGSDWALIELQVRNVGTSVTPLVGAWSRFNWHHPGPLLYYLLAVPYWLTGKSPLGIQLGAIAINATSIILTLVVLRHRGPVTLMLGALGLILLQFGLPANQLRTEWNASIPLMAFVLLLIAAWDLERGRRLAYVITPVCAVFLIQAHVAYGPLAAPALAVWAWSVWRHWNVDAIRRASLFALATAGLLSLPIMIDALAHRGGNALRLVKWSFTAHQGPGWSSALHLVGNQASLRVPFVTGLHSTIFGVLDPNAIGLLPGAMFVGLIAAGIFGSRSVKRLVAILLITWVPGLVATTRISGPLYPHVLWWALPLGMVSWLAIALFAVERLGSRQRSSRRVLVVLAASATGLAVILGVRVAGSDAQFADKHTAIVSFSNAIRKAAHGRATPTLAITSKYVDQGDIQAGVMAHLDHAGIFVRVPSSPQNVNVFPPERIDRHPGTTPAFLVTGRIGRFSPPGKLIASDDPLSRAEQHRWAADYLEIRAALLRAKKPELVGWLLTPNAWIARTQAPEVFAPLKATMRDLEQLNARGNANLLWLIPPH